jgi:ubiquinone/menaquinone biosynthesis C-methylase UbiE
MIPRDLQGDFMPAKTDSQPLTPQRLGQMAWSFAPPLIVEAAMKHRVFDLLDRGPRTVEDVAREAGISPRGLRAIMNALVSFDLLARDAQQRYALTPESATFLVTTKPSFQGGLFKHVSTHLISKWMQLDEIVRNGRPAQAVNQQNQGAKFFEQFVEDIFPMSYGAAQVLADNLKVPEARKPIRVLDIAAGSGVWGIALAQKSPQVTVTAVDWPDVLPVTRRVAKKHNLQDRFTFIAGDINEVGFGSGFDIATLGHILHSEGEPRSRALLKKVFTALAPGGTIAIAEFLANDEHTGPPQAMIFAVNMLVNTEQGDTFSHNEIGAWLRDVGFTDVRSLEAPAPSPLVLATKPR